MKGNPRCIMCNPDGPDAVGYCSRHALELVNRFARVEPPAEDES